MPRIIVISFSLLGIAAHAARSRFSSSARASLPQHLRRTLETLGAPFVKLGQALSLRRDLLPDDIVAALQGLQDHVPGFASAEARREIERELHRPIEQIFEEFSDTPLAAASIAQVHSARLRDGREVIVKVRRPGIRAQIDRDMRLLVTLLRTAEPTVPALKRYNAVSIVREIWARLRAETDFRQEAGNVRRFVEALRDQPTAYVPDVEEDLCTEAVLVQAMSHGRRIDDPTLKRDGPRLARALVDLYLHQFFVMGVFHGDPHPGNLFALPDGRICFHDFGVVGRLTAAMRRKLAAFVLALGYQDEDWLVEAAAELGVLSPAVDRRLARETVGAILADYAGRPLNEWSVSEVLFRLMRLGSGAGVTLPVNLAILARAAALVEQVLRGLDEQLTVVTALAHADPELLAKLFVARPDQGGLMRLKSEAATTAQTLPALAAEWLQRARREGGGVPITLRADSIAAAGGTAARAVDRLALALVALGLYIAASLLMQHSIGPRVFGDWPLFALVGYVLALWFTVRIVTSIGADERASPYRKER